MARSNKKGRTKFDNCVVLNRYEMRTEAFRHLSVYGRSGLLELLFRFDGKNNGDIHISVREMAKFLNCGKNKAAEVFIELVEKGWLKIGKKGSFYWKAHINPETKNSGRASTWILTNRKHQNHLATKDFMRWTPEKAKPGPSQKDHMVPQTETNTENR